MVNKGQSKTSQKNAFARNSGPYHGASVLLNKLLQQSETRQKNRKNSASQNNSNSAMHVGGLKSLVFVTKKDNSTEMICSKATYATLCQTLQSKPLIDKLLDQCPPSSGQNKKKISLRVILEAKCKNKGLLYILLHELLFSKFQKIKGGGGLKRVITQYEADLRKIQKSLHLTYNEVQNEYENNQKVKEGNKIRFPRYARVNTIKTRLEDVVSTLSTSTYKDTTDEKKKSSDGEEKENSLLKGNQKIYLDTHMPHLLVLPPEIMKSDAAKFYSHLLIQEGKLILQDKASCFPALALIHATTVSSADKSINSFDQIIDGDILDACAAPGNKTSHLAALLTEEYRKKELQNNLNGPKKKNKQKKKHDDWPKIIAFDRDPRRFKILKSRMEQLVSTSSEDTGSKFVEVHPIQTDFLQTSPSDPQFKNVKSILLDPSCSGSGIVTSPDRQESFEDKENDDDQKDRIQSLAKFQITCLRHAMSFPQVERIVYSTCSIHDLENEGVVSAVLAQNSASDLNIDDKAEEELECKEENESDENTWELIAPASLAGWERRGNAVAGLTEAQARCLVRCDALAGDDTNGFFVSCFQRKKFRRTLSQTEASESPSFVEFMCRDEEISIPFYNGEYKKFIAEDKKGNEINKECKISILTQALKNDVTINKKKEKKLLWKKRQRDQKEARLKAKKLRQMESNAD